MEENYFLFDGRPSGLSETEMETKIYDFLDSLFIDYQTLKHPAAFTMEECVRVRDKINAPVAKNLFLTNKQQTQFYLLVMPGDKVFKTKYLSSQINAARLSFANENLMRDLLGLTPGSVTPLGLLHDKATEVKLLIDSDLKKEKKFACHAGINTASIVMSFSDFENKVVPDLGHEILWVDLPRE